MISRPEEVVLDDDRISDRNTIYTNYIGWGELLEKQTNFEMLSGKTFCCTYEHNSFFLL